LGIDVSDLYGAVRFVEIDFNVITDVSRTVSRGVFVQRHANFLS
jgi:hypothetical protein